MLKEVCHGNFSKKSYLFPKEEQSLTSHHPYTRINPGSKLKDSYLVYCDGNHLDQAGVEGPGARCRGTEFMDKLE